ncbi:MAG: tetratricopeptide repeat protein [Bacteroidota bacterium]
MKMVSTILLVLFWFTVPAQIPKNSLQVIDSLIDADAFDEASTKLKILEDQSNSTDPLLYHVHILRGDWFLSQGDYMESIMAYKRVLEDDFPADSVGTLTVAKAINDLGIAYYKIGELDSAKWAHRQSIEIYRKYDFPLGLSYNYNNLSIIAKQEKRFEESLTMLGQALSAAIKAKDSLGIGFIYLNMGTTYADNTSRLKALDYLYRSIRIFDELEDANMSIRAKINLAGLYNRLGSYDSALALLRNAAVFYESSGNTRNQAYLSIRLAELFIDTDQLDSAQHHADLALKLAKNSQRSLNVARAYHLKSRIAKRRNNLDRAAEYLENGIPYVRGKFKGQEFVMRTELADVFLLQKSYKEAIKIAEYGLADVGTTPNLDTEVAAYQVLYKASKASGNDLDALKWLEKFKSAQDSLYNKEKSLEMARIEYRDYLQLKERQEANERARLQLDYERNLERQKWWQYSALGGAGLLLVILSLIYRSYVTQKRDHQLLEYKNETIEAKNEELLAKNEQLQALREKDYNSQQSERRLLQETIFLKERELAGTAMINHEKNSILRSIGDQLTDISASVTSDVKREINALTKMVTSNINSDASWDSFIHQFKRVHPEFFQKLKDLYPILTVNDLKLCAYIKVGMDNKEIAGATNTALSTVKKNINRLKKKIELSAEESVRDYLIQSI